MNNNNPIKVRKYYVFGIEMVSPILISGGEGMTDADVLTNGGGECFIPGSSLAGAFRSYLEWEKKQDKGSLFGYIAKNDSSEKTTLKDKDSSEEEKGRMSSIFISDLYFDDSAKVSVRDGVSLDTTKQINNKFDMEIVETGAKGYLFLEYVVREKDVFNETDMELALRRLMEGLDTGEVRLGSKKNRGYGRMKLTTVYEKTFSAANVSDWILFVSKRQEISSYGDAIKPEKWKDDNQYTWNADQRYVYISLPLRLKGGISIRKYSAMPGKADYEQLKTGDIPVIPGSSWNGAIRSTVRRILKDMGMKKVDSYLNDWFGSERGDASQSMIVFGESQITGGKSVPVSRTKIDRFDGSVIQKALYTENTWFGGETKLEIWIRKDEAKEYRTLLDAILFTLQDLCDGYLPVGGLVSIGRGIFEGDMTKMSISNLDEGEKPDDTARQCEATADESDQAKIMKSSRLYYCWEKEHEEGKA